MRVGTYVRTYQIAERVQEEIGSLVLVRNKACNGNIVLCFETVASFQIPIFFGAVSHFSIEWSCILLMHILVTGSCQLKTVRPQIIACSHLLNYERRVAVGCNSRVHFSPEGRVLIMVSSFDWYLLYFIAQTYTEKCNLVDICSSPPTWASLALLPTPRRSCCDPGEIGGL